MLTSSKRIIRTGFVNFWRNGFLSFAAIVVMTLSLTLLGAILFANAFGRELISDVKSKVDINVYFTLSAKPGDITDLQRTLQKLPEVASVDYISSDNALANFKDKWKDNTLILQGLDEIGYNPLPAVLNITAKDPSQYAGIADFLNGKNALTKDGSTIIDKVNYNQNKLVIDRLTRIISIVQTIGTVLAIVFIIVAVIIVFNTIRLIIYNARDEIGVMKLVGASNTYVRGPFVISGMMYGVVSGLITLGVLAIFAYYTDAAVVKLIGIEGANDFSLIVNVLARYFVTNFGQIFAIIMGSGVVLGGLSSYIAVKRYLRV